MTNGRTVGAWVCVCAALATAASAETWYLKGGGAHKGDWGYDWFATGEGCNWTNAVGAAGVPAAGDAVVLPEKDPETGGNITVSAASGTMPPLAAFTAPGPFTLHQGTLVMRAGGAGVFVGADSWWWADLVCRANPNDPAAEGVVVTVPDGVTFNLQKGITCTGTDVIKAGGGTLVNLAQGFNPYYADLKDLTVRLRGGTFVNHTTNLLQGVRLVFDSDDPNLRVKIGKAEKLSWNWGIRDGAIEESPAVSNTAHGFTSEDGVEAQALTLCGTPTVNPMRFTGTFYRRAGLVWNPDAADAAFVFAKAVSHTTGELLVSNGVVRLVEGATFSRLSRLDVAAGAQFVVEAGAGSGFMAQEAALAAGSRVVVGKDVSLTFNRATFNGVALAPGLHTAATAPDWLSGDGLVYVVSNTGAPETPSAATWTGGGADTLLATAANWEGGAVPDFETGGLTATFAADGERATFAADGFVRFAGLVFTRAFTLDRAADATGRALLGAGGVQTPDADDARTYEIAWPLAAAAPQTWYAATNATLRWTAPLSGFSALDRILVDGPGTQEFGAANTFPNDMTLTNGTVRFAGDGAMGEAAGTTDVDLRRVRLRFGGGVNTRSLVYFRGDGVEVVPYTVAVEAGTTNRFEGRVVHKAVNGNYATLDVTLGKDAELVFAGETSLNYVNFRTAGNAPAHLVVTNMPLTVNDRLNFYSEALTVDLWTARNKVSGNMSYWQSGRVRTRVPYALDATAYNGNATNVKLEGDAFTLDLCGNDQALGVLHGVAGTVTSDAPALLHLAQNHIPSWWDNGGEAFNGIPYVGITNKVAFTGQAGISLDADARYADTFPHVLTAASCSSGTVQVTRGRLTLAAPDGAWTNAAAAVVKGGTLVFEHGGAIGRQTDVFIEGGGVLELAAGVVQTCRDLFFDGVRQPIGTWGSSASGARRKNDERFAGTGVLNVLSDGKGLALILR